MAIYAERYTAYHEPAHIIQSQLRARTPAHRLRRRTTKYLLKQKMTHCSTYTTPDLPPTLAARFPYAKASIPTNIVQSNPPNQLPTYHAGSFLGIYRTQQPAAFNHTLYTTVRPLSYTPPASQYATLQLPNAMHCLQRNCASFCIYPHQLRGNIR